MYRQRNQMPRKKKEYFNEYTEDGKKLRKTADYSLDADLPDDVRPTEKSPDEQLIETESYNNLAEYLNSTLTDRQKKILRMLETGKTQAEIAKALSVHHSSIQETILQIRKKTQFFIDSQKI